VEAGLAAQGRGQTVEPRMHLMPNASFNGHFNVLRGYVAPMNLAGVKCGGRLRGQSLSDIALGHAMLDTAARLGIGQRLRFA